VTHAGQVSLSYHNADSRRPLKLGIGVATLKFWKHLASSSDIPHTDAKAEENTFDKLLLNEQILD